MMWFSSGLCQIAQYVTRGTWKARCDLAQINICQIAKYGIKARCDLAQINILCQTAQYGTTGT